MTITQERIRTDPEESSADPRWGELGGLLKDADTAGLIEVIERSAPETEESPRPYDSAIQPQESRIGRFLRNTANRADQGAQSLAEKKEQTARVLREAGQAGLVALEKTGHGIVFGAEVAAGAAILTGRAISETTTDVVLGAKEAAVMAGQKIKEGAETANNAILDASDRFADFTYAKVDQARDFGQEKINNLREWVSQKAENARNRRQARREKWSMRKQQVLETYGQVKDFATDKYDQARSFTTQEINRGVENIHLLRAAGRAGIDAAKATANTHREQNRL